MRYLFLALPLMLSAPAVAQLGAYHGGVLLSRNYANGYFETSLGQAIVLTRRENLVGGTGTFVDYGVEQQCSGTAACYGQILHLQGDVQMPGGLAGDMVRVDNSGATGPAIGRKTAVRGNDGWGSWGHAINLSRAHAGVFINSDNYQFEGRARDRTAFGVLVLDVDVTTAVVRWNQAGGGGWFFQMLTPDGRVYGMDGNGVLHVRKIIAEE